MKRVAAALVGVAVAVVWGRHAMAQQPFPERPLDPIVLAWDKGPNKIDVSKYPPEMKDKYKIFSELCSKCHPLARAINCDFVLEDEWERYIKKMMRRGGTLINASDAQQIFEFAVYDSQARKRELYNRKVAAGRR